MIELVTWGLFFGPLFYLAFLWGYVAGIEKATGKKVRFFVFK